MSNVLINRLPYLYEQSQEVDSIQKAIEGERLVLEDKLLDLYNQSFIESADWSLYMWENLLGIKPTTDDLSARKENILARIRSKGVTTRRALENLCTTYAGGDVKIIEDFNSYSFLVKFISEESIPSNLDGLTKTINNVIPSHLSWDYIFAYNIWLQCKDLPWTLTSETWGDDKTADFIDSEMKAICSNNTLCSGLLLVGSGI